MVVRFLTIAPKVTKHESTCLLLGGYLKYEIPIDKIDDLRNRVVTIIQKYQNKSSEIYSLSYFNWPKTPSLKTLTTTSWRTYVYRNSRRHFFS